MTQRKLAFIQANTDCGQLIVNRYDFLRTEKGAYGVSLSLLETGTYEPETIKAIIRMTDLREEGKRLVILDGGANIGAHTISWAQMIDCVVLAFEPQRSLYYALCGNIVLNNCFNIRPFHAALGAAPGFIEVPIIDYAEPASYGSLELRHNPEGNEPIGQPVNYGNTYKVELAAIDQMELEHLDVLKLDIEGMELEALAGAEKTILRCKPLIVVEVLKGGQAVYDWLIAHDYEICQRFDDRNIIAIHKDDPIIKEMADMGMINKAE